MRKHLYGKRRALEHIHWRHCIRATIGSVKLKAFAKASLFVMGKGREWRGEER